MFLIKWFAKKYALSMVNDALEAGKEKKAVQDWKARIAKVIAFLNSLMEKLEDDKITEEEAEKVIEEVKGLF